MSDNIEYIEKYLSNALDKNQRAQFENELKSNSELSKDFQKYKVIHAALELDIENDLRSYLQDKDATSIENSPRIRKLPSWSRMSIAASFLIIIAAGIWWSINANTENDLIANNFIHYEQSVLRGSKGELSESLAIIISDNTDKDKRIEKLEALKNENLDDMQLNFILAESYFENGQRGKASKLFELIYNSNSILWKDKAEWNLMLIYSEIDKQASKAILDRILSNEEHAYFNKAKEIQNLIE